MDGAELRAGAAGAGLAGTALAGVFLAGAGLDADLLGFLATTRLAGAALAVDLARALGATFGDVFDAFFFAGVLLGTRSSEVDEWHGSN